MKVRLKAPADQAAGRQLQELVYYLWRGVQYARGWVRGSNPGSTDQVLARAAFATITKRWETLSAATREGWDTWASANLVVDSLGREVRMPALAAYVRVNTIKYAMAGSFTDTAPTSSAPTPPTAVGTYLLAGSGTENSLTSVAHGYSTVTGLKLLVKQTALASPAVAMRPGRAPMFSGFDSGSFLTLAASGQPYMLTAARAVYQAGASVGVELQIVNSDGLLSIPFTANLLCEDA